MSNLSNKEVLTVEQGASFDMEIEIVDTSINLLTFTAKAAFAKDYHTNNKIQFVTNFANNLLELSLSSNATANIEPGKYVYDVILVSPSDNTVIRILEGILFLTPGVTFND